MLGSLIRLLATQAYGGIDENRSGNWLDAHDPSTDHSSQSKQRSTMKLVFDSTGPRTNPHLPAPAQA